MKIFSFPLDRVLAWRQTQVRLEEAKLAHLASELRAIDLRHAAIDQSVVEAGLSLLSAAAATSLEIGALEHYRATASSEVQNLGKSRRSLEQKITVQSQAVLERRREAQLLEQLRKRRLTIWQASVAREVEQQAEESFLARFTRAQPFH